MGDLDKTKNKLEQVEGRSKQVAGAATGDTSTEREGRIEEAKGDLKQAGEKVKDALHAND
jgi:uncharacterized protein YjbJ (UPF0337 family)